MREREGMQSKALQIKCQMMFDSLEKMVDPFCEKQDVKLFKVNDPDPLFK